MKVTFLNKLNEDELQIFEESNVYIKSQEKSNYSKLINKYNQEYFPDEYENTSLVLWDNQEPLLFIPSYSINKVFSFFGSPVEIFESNSELNLAESYKFFLKYLTEFFKREKYEYFLFNSNSYFLNDFYSKIIEFNTSYIGVIDLMNEVSFIKSSFRKSYKSLINWGERELTTKIINNENYTNSHIEEFRDFHITVSGKETRSKETWDLQGEIIKNKKGFIVRSEFEGKLAAISFYQYGSSSILYGVGVYDRELMEKNHPMAHSSLFSAIKEAKKIGLKEMVLGDVNSSNPNYKEAQIAKFKKGFANQCLAVGNYKVKLI